MNNTMLAKKIVLGLSSAGLLFSGYLSGVKFFSGTCAFNEGCPFFLGYPACYFGFVMYLTLFVLSVCYYRGRVDPKMIRSGLMLVSALGIGFAGYFTLGELPKLFSDGLAAYVLGLPTCALGLIFYTLIFGTLIYEGKQK